MPRSLWKQIKDDLVSITDSLPQGDVTDLSNFMGAVIDDRAFAKHKDAIDRAHATDGVQVVAGGTYDDSEGYFVRPTVLQIDDPTDESFRTEYFGPILSVHVYDDRSYDKVLDQMESFAPYALTGVDHRPGPARHRRRHRAAALRGGQLLHQRQADRRRRRPAAVRRRPRVRHQRQGRRRPEPDPLDLRPLDQGDLRPADDHTYPHMG